MDYSDAENDSDGELSDDILGAEDLFSDEAEEADNDSQSNHGKTEEKMGIEDDASKKEKKEKKIRQPRVVKNPRVTLNFESLRGKNGLSALKMLFKNFKFKGNGHEKEDLTKIMGIFQQWMCYQLCPGYSFESCLLQVEALGKKKIVQTLMKKYRLGMDEWGENMSAAEDSVEAAEAKEINENLNRDDEFDLLLDEEIANAESDTEKNQNDAIGVEGAQREPVIILTQEQLERIERNRKLAEERKRLRRNANCEQVPSNEKSEISVANVSLECNK